MKTLFLFAITALAEIAGCFISYAVLRLGRHPSWLLGAAASLALFAWLLTLHPSSAAGRVYAAYGGVYIGASLLWLWLVEGHMPDRWDIIGAAVCLIGSAIIILPARN